MFGFVPDSPPNGWQRSSAAEHLEDPTAYILQLTVSDGNSQKADIQRMDGTENKSVLERRYALFWLVILACLKQPVLSDAYLYQSKFLASA